MIQRDDVPIYEHTRKNTVTTEYSRDIVDIKHTTINTNKLLDAIF